MSRLEVFGLVEKPVWRSAPLIDHSSWSVRTAASSVAKLQVDETLYLQPCSVGSVALCSIVVQRADTRRQSDGYTRNKVRLPPPVACSVLEVMASENKDERRSEHRKHRTTRR